MHNSFKGRNIAIITMPGDPPKCLLMLYLWEVIPGIADEDQNRILAMMNPGASALNPIDMIATATLQQLDNVVEYVDKELEAIDGMSVIFGNNGLTNMKEVYELLHKKIRDCNKPLYPILPSISSSHEELEGFMNKGHVNFPDEVVLGRALTKIMNTPYPAEEKIFLENVDVPGIRKIIDRSETGYLEPSVIQELLYAADIPVVKEAVTSTKNEIISLATQMGYPLALKVVGPVHKSDVGGVTLNIRSQKHLEAEFIRMNNIEGVTGVMLQQMISGTELFIGAKYEPRFGHIILCGLGGIFVEVLGDVSSGLLRLHSMRLTQ
jgi:acetyltransferase